MHIQIWKKKKNAIHVPISMLLEKNEYKLMSIIFFFCPLTFTKTINEVFIIRVFLVLKV